MIISNHHFRRADTSRQWVEDRIEYRFVIALSKDTMTPGSPDINISRRHDRTSCIMPGAHRDGTMNARNFSRCITVDGCTVSELFRLRVECTTDYHLATKIYHAL